MSERFIDIKTRVNNTDGPIMYVPSEHMQFLIERVEELESGCIHCNGKGFNGLEYCPQCDHGKKMRLEQQNNRYREALEFYADTENHQPSQYVGGLKLYTGDAGKKARQTLEESE